MIKPIIVIEYRLILNGWLELTITDCQVWITNQGGALTIAKLVQITPMTRTYGRYIYNYIYICIIIYIHINIYIERVSGFHGFISQIKNQFVTVGHRAPHCCWLKTFWQNLARACPIPNWAISWFCGQQITNQ